MTLIEVQEEMKNYTYEEIARNTGLNRLTVRSIATSEKFLYQNFLKVVQFLEKNNRK